MKVEGDWLARPQTQAVFAALSAQGAQVWAVGGCLRDALLDLPVRDVDLATDALPDRVMAAAAAAGLRAVPTGIAHGTITVVSGNIAHEVTTLRQDMQTDGRHAVVAFTDRLEVDAARRDLTMNALYATADGQVIDPLGGLPDLLARRVRFVGDPAQRIAEDRLRILRFFRFAATYADPAHGIDAEGLAACAAGADGIDRLSRERVGAEMRRLLDAPDPAPVVASMTQAGVLAHVLPGADPAALAPLVHLEITGDHPASWLRRLAVLGADDPVTALRLSRDEGAMLKAIRDCATGGLTHAALGFRLRDLAEDAGLIRAALSGVELPPGWRTEIARGQRFVTAPVTASDLMPTLQGAALGARLAQLTDRWLASDLRLTRDELLGGT